MRRPFGSMAALVCAATFPAVVLPAAAQEVTRVTFDRGADTAAFEGKLTGAGYVDYILGARADQTMYVAFDAHGSAAFDVLPPGGAGNVVYNGAIDGNDATIRLRADGDYAIRIYLTGNDRETGATVPYVFTVTVL